jgi:hypothetical protein
LWAGTAILPPPGDFALLLSCNVGLKETEQREIAITNNAFKRKGSIKDNLDFGHVDVLVFLVL